MWKQDKFAQNWQRSRHQFASETLPKSAKLELRAEGLEEEALAANKETVRLVPRWSGGHIQLGRLLWGKGLRQEAIAAYEKAIRLMRLPSDDYGGDYFTARNELAWILATSPDDKLRDPQRAVELAREAVAAQPKSAAYWKTLGWAQFRAGNWPAAVTALEKVKELGSAGDSLEWFPLAMAHWRLGNKPAARKYYDQAVQWMEKDARKNDQLRRDKVATYRDKHAAYGQTLGPDLKNVDLRHLRAEAEQVLGIQKKN